MARTFKMHRAGPAPNVNAQARAGIAPLGSRANKAAGRARLAARRTPKLAETAPPLPAPVKEIGGPEGPEPTRYGDWEKNGICYDY